MAPLIQVLLWTLLASGQPSQPVRDIEGRAMNIFKPASTANVLVFVTSDCPISNGYAPAIQQLCAAYEKRGVSCSLFYEDAAIEPAAVRKHLSEFRYRGLTAVIDRNGAVARQAGATVTPQAVVVDANGQVRYSGRIDNKYVELGQQRRVVTEYNLEDALDAVLEGRAVANPQTTAVGCYIASR